MSIWLTKALNKIKGKRNPNKGSEFILFLNNSASFFPPDGNKNEKEGSQKKKIKVIIITLPIDRIIRSLKTMNPSRISKDFIFYWF